MAMFKNSFCQNSKKLFLRALFPFLRRCASVQYAHPGNFTLHSTLFYIYCSKHRDVPRSYHVELNAVLSKYHKRFYTAYRYIHNLLFLCNCGSPSCTPLPLVELSLKGSFAVVISQFKSTSRVTYGYSNGANQSLNKLFRYSFQCRLCPC